MGLTDESRLYTHFDTQGVINESDRSRSNQLAQNTVIANGRLNAGPKTHSIVLPDDAGSTDMNVDGSAAPIDFIASVPQGEKWNLYSFGLGIQDGGTASRVDFGNGPELVNGIDLIITLNSVEHIIANFKSNMGIAFLFTATVLGSSKQFIDDDNLFAGEYKINPEIELIGDNNDNIIYRINDNLTQIDFIRSAIKYWRVI